MAQLRSSWRHEGKDQTQNSGATPVVMWHLPRWVVVKIMVPFGVPILIRHLIFRVPKRDHNFDNHPDQVNWGSTQGKESAAEPGQMRRIWAYYGPQ